MDMQSLITLSDAELLSQVKRLAHAERQATARLVAHLAELDKRKLYLQEGCASLFTYCVQVLHLSEAAAYNRIEAARAAARFPAVLASLEQGDVHLTAIKLLSPLLTPENHHELLVAAQHKSKREIEELVARRHPRPDAPSVVRKLPAGGRPPAAVQPPTAPKAANVYETPASGTDETASIGFNLTEASAELAAASRPAPAPLSPSRAAVVTPLGPERYKVQFTATAATRAKLRRAQDLMRHRIPDGDVAQVIDAALDLLVRELEKRKFAASSQQRRDSRPMDTRPTDTPGRHIPAHVKRAVWERDQGQCTFVSANGMRCTERGRLEFDHIHPHADGGGHDVTNIRLLCRQHNQHAARLFFGVWQGEAAALASDACSSHAGG